MPGPGPGRASRSITRGRSPRSDYSSRYGPLPPCFARGTIITHPVSGRRMLLAAGTASIRGEESVHVGDLRSQMRETLENLASLLTASQPGGDHYVGRQIY